MFDSLTIARQLTEAGIERAQADVLADAIRQAAEHGEHVTPETLVQSWGPSSPSSGCSADFRYEHGPIRNPAPPCGSLVSPF